MTRKKMLDVCSVLGLNSFIHINKLFNEKGIVHNWNFNHVINSML